MATVSLDSVSKAYGATPAVADAQLDVRSGELLALLGPSGCGKSTLLRLIAGFDVPDAGEIRIGDRAVTGARWVAPEDRQVGMVFQDYALFPHLTVAENVAFGLTGGRPRRRGRGAGHPRVAAVLELVGLAGLEARYPHELSGGQQQRVALARALAPSPSVVLLDEPFSAIDPMQRGLMRGELAEIFAAEGTTVLLVTHDQEEALGLADRVALMRDGAIVQVDVPERIYHSPVDRWSAEFVGLANVLDRGHAARLGVTSPTPGEEVVLRPELVGLACDEDGPGEIVGREFRGHDVMYRVRFGDGSWLWSQRPSNELVPLGSRVRVRVLDGPFPAYPSPA